MLQGPPKTSSSSYNDNEELLDHQLRFITKQMGVSQTLFHSIWEMNIQKSRDLISKEIDNIKPLASCLVKQSIDKKNLAMFKLLLENNTFIPNKQETINYEEFLEALRQNENQQFTILACHANPHIWEDLLKKKTEDIHKNR
jgi:hypothetical protein